MNRPKAEFGTYQDALADNKPRLYHSLLSAYINLGLLGPMESASGQNGALMITHWHKKVR